MKRSSHVATFSLAAAAVSILTVWRRSLALKIVFAMAVLAVDCTAAPVYGYKVIAKYPTRPTATPKVSSTSTASSTRAQD